VEILSLTAGAGVTLLVGLILAFATRTADRQLSVARFEGAASEQIVSLGQAVSDVRRDVSDVRADLLEVRKEVERRFSSLPCRSGQLECINSNADRLVHNG
jgi:hypothetical protein